MENKLSTGLLGVIAVVLVSLLLFKGDNPVSLGSVNRANEYFATSTAPNTVYGARSADFLAIEGSGALGSIVISGAGTAGINVFDATTTNITLRAASMSTSSILIASVPPSAAAGTYTFDTLYEVALYIDIEGAGNAPTTTITYR